MSEYKNVEGNTDLLRTPRGNIVNTNKKALQQARVKKQKEKEMSETINKVKVMEKDISEIKSMLRELVNK